MKTRTIKFEKGKKYMIDDIEYPQSKFDQSFVNLGRYGEIDEGTTSGDNVMCLRNCSMTIRYDDSEDLDELKERFALESKNGEVKE